jgi:hypothetical protein
VRPSRSRRLRISGRGLHGSVRRSGAWLALAAVAIAGALLPHLVALLASPRHPSEADLAVGLPGLLGMVGTVLASALVVRSARGHRVGLIVAVVTLSPLLAFSLQEILESVLPVADSHAEPATLAALVAQAPLVVIAALVARVLLAAGHAVVRALRAANPSRPGAYARSAILRRPSQGLGVRRMTAPVTANAGRAPPRVPATA